MVDRVYMLTDLGRRMGSHPGPNNRDEVIDYIYNNKTARLSEISMEIGKPERLAQKDLKGYVKRGIVAELTQG
jgi:predicted DNA-binding transcriptional regulator